MVCINGAKVFFFLNKIMNKEFHTGKLIQQIMEDEGKKAEWLAKKIHCHKKHIYRIYKQEHIHPQLLARISIILQYNFFSHYFEYVNEQINR